MAALQLTMDKGDILSKINDISQILREANESTHQAIFVLSPPLLNDIGLVAALTDWLDGEMKGKHGINYAVFGGKQKYLMKHEVRYLLFRCVLELFINIIKHSRASNVKLNFQYRNDILTISVHDNGSGFSYNPKDFRRKDSGFGLFSIHERIDRLGGTMVVETAPGLGTKIDLNLPLSNHESL